jgi:transposase
VDGVGRPLVVLVSAGQANDAPVFEHLLAHLKVGRANGGAPRTRPDRVRADKAYSSRAIRAELRRRGITAVIPEPSDQIAHRKRRGPVGGRPPAFDAADYKGRNVIERGFNVVNPRRGLATRYDNLAIVYRGAAVLRTITIVARDVRFSDGGVDMNGHSDWFGTWADTIHRSPSRSFR